MGSKTYQGKIKPEQWIITVVGGLLLGFSAGALLFPPYIIENSIPGFLSASWYYPVSLVIKGILIIVGFLMWNQIRHNNLLNKTFWAVAIVSIITEFVIAISFVSH